MPTSDGVTIQLSGRPEFDGAGPLRLPRKNRGTGSYLKSSVAVALAVVVSGCAGTESGSRDGFNEVPTRTTPVATSTVPVTEAGGALAVNDFTVLPTFVCLREQPARAVVTVGWSAPSATEVLLSLDGRRLPVGIQDELPYQVPAGGPAGIGAAVVFDCNAASLRTIDIEWTAPGIPSASRAVTVIKESTNG